jgi:phospholipid transport system transporter-binding protein
VSTLNIINQGSGHINLEGDLTFTTISTELSNLLALLTLSKRIIIDLTQISSVDSAGLALLIEWKKLARTHKTQLALKNIPEQLLMLARLSGFDLVSHFTIQSD